MGNFPLGAYESLAGLLVSHSPDGVGIGPLSLSVHRMSSLFPTGITPCGDHCVNRTRVRKSSAIGSTCLSRSIDLTGCYPTGRENNQRVWLSFSESTPNVLQRDLVRIDAWVSPVRRRGTLDAQARLQSDGTLQGFKLRVRSCRRWQLKVCRWIYEVFCTSACTSGFATHVEARSPPKN